MSENFPVLSLGERDRRWALARSFLAENDLECMIMFGMKGRERFDGYLANECGDGIVVLPREGDPVHLVWTPTRVLRRIVKEDEGIESWISDIRVGNYAKGVVEVVKERGLEKKRIGIVGLKLNAPAEGDGIIPYNLWVEVLDGLPGVEFVDVSLGFGKKMLVKSDEEQAAIRFACQIGEKACQAMFDATRVGASEYDIYADIMRTIHAHGAISVEPHLILALGPNEIGWGHPLWNYSGGPPTVVKSGEMVQAEIFPVYCGIETQVQMSIGVGAIGDTNRELGDVARQSYEAGLATLKPGATLQELCDAMSKPMIDAECYTVTPLNHSLAPLFWHSGGGQSTDRMTSRDRIKLVAGSGPPPLDGEFVIEEGMIWQFEPNACRGDHRVNIGGNVLVTADGVEELNDMPTRMHLKN